MKKLIKKILAPLILEVLKENQKEVKLIFPSSAQADPPLLAKEIESVLLEAVSAASKDAG